MLRFPVSSRRRLAGLVTVALAALGTGSAALASERSADGSDTRGLSAGGRAEDRSDKVCRRVRPVGSNIPQTICRTRQQMADEEAAAREALNENRVRMD